MGMDERAQVSADRDVIRARFLFGEVLRKTIIVQVASFSSFEGVD